MSEQESGKPSEEPPTVMGSKEQLSKIIQANLPDEVGEKKQVDPKEVADSIAASLISIEETSESVVHFQGPHPPPAAIKAYEEAYPGSAAKIFVRADREQEFRHFMGKEHSRLEHRIVTHSAAAGYLGQAGAFFLSIFALALGAYLAATGNNVAGFGTIILAVASLVGAFITGKVVDYLTSNNAPAAEESDGEES